MKINSLIVDEFFEPIVASQLRLETVTKEFKDHMNPVDGVTYPGILRADEVVRSLVETSLLSHFDYAKIKLKDVFFRLSIWGTSAPQQAHTDVTMGKYTLLVYMNDVYPKVYCGTTILEHASGMMPTNPQNSYQELVANNDKNNAQAWTIVGMCQAKFNRAFIIRSDLFHRSEPVGGFGVDNIDGRLVLCAFFEVLGEK